MIKVLFVCLGNICRSPLAEAIFNDLVKKKELNDKIASDSAGTAAYHLGQNPDPRSIEVANKNNIPISHRGRQFSFNDLEYFSYIVAMDRQNLANILQKGGVSNENVFLMRDFDTIERGGEVPDPYYGGPAGFDRVFQILQRSNMNFLDHLIKEHRLNI